MSDETANTIGRLVCGHTSPASFWPCAEPVGHHGSHQNAAKGWARQPDDDCPPEGAVGFTREDVDALDCMTAEDFDGTTLRVLAAKIAALLPPETP